MKKLFLDNTMKIIIKNYNYSETKLAEIRYGLESIYLTIFKIVVITLLAIVFKVFAEYIMIMCFYSLLKLTGFGVHAKKSLHCWISSILIFLGAPILSTYLELPKMLIIALSIICVLLIMRFAPADTEKRPIINKKRRLIYKICCTSTAVIYLFIIIFTNNIILHNTLLLSMMIQAFVILPVSYKIFGVRYDNYKTYNLATNI